MPKMKTNSGAKKRFTLTGSGKIKRKHAFKRHILTKKTNKQKRNLGGVVLRRSGVAESHLLAGEPASLPTRCQPFREVEHLSGHDGGDVDAG